MFLACVVRSMVCLSEKLYVFGGEREEDHRELKLKWSNSEEDKWIRKTTIPGSFSRYDGEPVFNGCVLKLSQGVLDQLKVVN